MARLNGIEMSQQERSLHGAWSSLSESSESSSSSSSSSSNSSTEGLCGVQPYTVSFQPFKDQGSVYGLGRWQSSLSHRVGHRLLVLLVAAQHVLKGCAGTLAWKAMPYVFKHYHLPAQQVQILNTVAGLPWVLKPVVGLVSDLCPIRGYRKAPYMMAASVLGIGACLAAGLVPLSRTPVQVLVACCFLFENQVTTNDLLTEAIWAERLQVTPSLGPDLLTFVFAGNQAASLVAVITSGFAIQYLGAQSMFLLVAVLACPVLYPLALGYTEESPLTAEAVAQLRQKFWEQREACALAAVMLACAACICVSGLLSSDPAVNAAVSAAAACTVLATFSLALSPVIAKFAAFSLIQTSMSLSVQGPAFYFLTDTPEEYPEGPHFSIVFFNTVLGSVGGLCSLLGFCTYRRFSTAISYRSLLVMANLTLSLLHLCDLLLFSRANLRLGLPDRLFVLGGAVLGPVIAQWHWMPQVALFSSLCPKDMEATMFALVVGCHNLGVGVAASAGSLLLKFLGCNPRGDAGDSEQLQNLWIASGISSLLPMLSVVLLFRLVPEGRQGERVEGSLNATAGSLWKRLMEA